MNFVIIALIVLSLAGCGPTAYQTAKQDIAKQYSELEQVQDLSLRQQKFAELQQRELMLESQQQASQAAAAQVAQAYLLYLGMTSPQTYNLQGIVIPGPGINAFR